MWVLRDWRRGWGGEGLVGEEGGEEKGFYVFFLTKEIEPTQDVNIW